VHERRVRGATGRDASTRENARRQASESLLVVDGGGLEGGYRLTQDCPVPRPIPCSEKETLRCALRRTPLSAPSSRERRPWPGASRISAEIPVQLACSVRTEVSGEDWGECTPAVGIRVSVLPCVARHSNKRNWRFIGTPGAHLSTERFYEISGIRRGANPSAGDSRDRSHVAGVDAFHGMIVVRKNL